MGWEEVPPTGEKERLACLHRSRTWALGRLFLITLSYKYQTTENSVSKLNKMASQSSCQSPVEPLDKALGQLSTASQPRDQRE